MFEKNMRDAFLLDAYVEVLDDHAKAIMTAYYEDDLSLAEIAENEGISRQGIRHIIKKGEEELFFLEGHLGLASEFTEIQSVAKELISVSEGLSNHKDESVKALAKKALRCAEIILSKN